MSKSRKSSRSPGSRERRTRADRPRGSRRGQGRAIVTAVAVLAVVAVVAVGVLLVRAGNADRGPRITLYQGQAALGGDELTLASLLQRGQPVVVNFWASNCPPCRQEMPGFQRVYAEEGGRGYLMLGVDVGSQTGLGTRQGARALLRQEGIEYPVGYAEGNQLLARYGLRGMPTTLFFDASGRQVGRVVGYLDEARLRARLDTLLAGTG